MAVPKRRIAKRKAQLNRIIHGQTKKRSGVVNKVSITKGISGTRNNTDKDILKAIHEVAEAC